MRTFFISAFAFVALAAFYIVGAIGGFFVLLASAFWALFIRLCRTP